MRIDAFRHGLALPLAVLLAAPAFGFSKDAAPMPNVQIEETVSPSGFSVSLGTTYWSGDFGFPTQSHLFVAGLSLRYEAENFRVWTTLPYMRVESDATLFAGSDGGPIFADAVLPPQGRVRDGFGDITVGATWMAVDAEDTGISLDLTSRVKLPTASDSSGLSTGQTDVSIAADVAVPLDGVIPFVSVGYTFFGDPAGIDLQNALSLSVGGSVPFGDREDGVFLLAYEFDESSAAVFDDRHELFTAVSTDVSDTFNLTGYGTVGLNESAADFAIGALFTFAF